MNSKIGVFAAFGAVFFLTVPALAPAWAQGGGASQTQEWEEGTSFIDVTCWGQLAENAGESVGRGTRVTVTGRLDQRSWETDNGDKRSKVEIVADDVAVSLRWATASVAKNERRDGFDSGGGQQGGRSFGSPAGNQQQAPAYQPDEEPF